MTRSVNLPAVGVSAIAGFVLGFMWFGVLFRRPYLDGLGKTAEELAKGPSTLQASLLQLAGNLVMAYVLARLILHQGQRTIMGGVGVGALAWLGFVAAVIGPMYAFQAFSFQFFAVTAGYPLVALLIMGAILGWFDAKGPSDLEATGSAGPASEGRTRVSR